MNVQPDRHTRQGAGCLVESSVRVQAALAKAYHVHVSILCYCRMKHILLCAARDQYFSVSGDRARQFDSLVIMLDYLIVRALRSGTGSRIKIFHGYYKDIKDSCNIFQQFF